MEPKDRVGYDSGGGVQLEVSLAWAAQHGLHAVDFNAERAVNLLTTWSDQRVRAVRETCERHDLHLGLHTSSGVNTAEFAPFVAPSIDEYLRASIDFGKRLGCDWIVVHAGFHFSSQLPQRMQAARDRLQRATDHAEQAGVQLVLENLNHEPDDAEVHYLAHNVEECRYFFDAIQSPHLGWAFTVNHAHLVPEGIDGFFEAFGAARLGEVRLADNRGDKEQHLLLGQGTIDFPSIFGKLEAAGYRGPYTMNYGAVDDMLRDRDYFAAMVKNPPKWR